MGVDVDVRYLSPQDLPTRIACFLLIYTKSTIKKYCLII